MELYGQEHETPAYDADLQALALRSLSGEVALSPEFARDHNDYKVQVAHETDRLTVTAQVYDARATVTASVYGEAGNLVWGRSLSCPARRARPFLSP